MPTPDFTELAFQKVSADSLALFIIWRCSNSFVKITYQLPMDMMAMMTSVLWATKSPWVHRAFRPYGLSTASVVTAGVSCRSGLGVLAPVPGQGLAWQPAGSEAAWARALMRHAEGEDETGQQGRHGLGLPTSGLAW